MALRGRLRAAYLLTTYVGRPLTVPIARKVGMKLSPNATTAIATVVGVGSGVAIGLGQMILGATLIFATFLLDCLDGDIARVTGRVTRVGEFLDATLDRVVDAVIVGAFIIYGQETFLFPGLLLITGSFLVSYVRRMASSLGVECKVGLAGRDLRLVLLALIAILFWFDAFYAWLALWGLAALALITAIHRIVYVAKRL